MDGGVSVAAAQKDASVCPARPSGFAPRYGHVTESPRRPEPAVLNQARLRKNAVGERSTFGRMKLGLRNTGPSRSGQPAAGNARP